LKLACDALLAVTWNMYTRMQTANREGFTHLIIEGDFKLLIDIVTKSCKLNRNIPYLG